MPSWKQAWQDAAASFYSREKPADHFRTAADSLDVAHAISTLVLHVAAQDSSASADVVDVIDVVDVVDVVDVGGGDGRLLVAVMERLRLLAPEVAARCRPVVVDLRPRPPDLPRDIAWIQGSAPEAVPSSVTGVLIAHELLDDIPLDVLHVDDAGALRVVNVDVAAGTESLGDPADAELVRWCDAWVADRRPGDRVEAGLARDSTWIALASRLQHGVAIAVDYATDGYAAEQSQATNRRTGTLTGYRDGHQQHPVPDGSMNLTAHVRLDSCAQAVTDATDARQCDLTTIRLVQREALDLLAPLEAEPTRGPQQRLELLGRRSRRTDVGDPTGPGAFDWLIQCIDVPPPSALRTGTMPR